MKTNNHVIKTLAVTALAVMAFSSTQTQAGIILQPTTTSLVYNPGGAAADGALINGINSVGFDGTGAPTSTVDNGAPDPGNVALLPQHYEGPAYAARLAGNFASAAIQFDLSAKFTITGIYLWNYQEYYAPGNPWYDERGLKSVTVDLYNGVSLVSSQAVTFAAASQGYYYQAGFYALTPTANVDTVVFAINTNQAGATTGYAGFSEVRFAAVPEPATWALLAGGLTTVMVLRRRRA